MHSAEYARRFVHPDDMEMVGEETRKAIETTDPDFSRQIEHRIIYADGTIGHIIVRFFIIKDDHQRTIKTYGVNQDITERRKAEEALRERDIRFKKLSFHVPGMIYQFMRRQDGTYCVPFSTEAIKDIFGCTPEDVREYSLP